MTTPQLPDRSSSLCGRLSSLFRTGLVSLTGALCLLWMLTILTDVGLRIINSKERSVVFIASNGRLLVHVDTFLYPINTSSLLNLPAN